MLADTFLLRGAKGSGVCWILEGIKFPCVEASLELCVLSGAQSEGRALLLLCVLSPQLWERRIRTISECWQQLHMLLKVSLWLWGKGECLVLV